MQQDPSNTASLEFEIVAEEIAALPCHSDCPNSHRHEVAQSMSKQH